MDIILTINKLSEVENLPNGGSAFSYFDAVNMKFGEWSKAGEMPEGTRRFAWAWAPYTNPQHAAVFAEHAAHNCMVHGIERFHLNAEAQMAGTGKYHSVENPYVNNRVFAETFRKRSPGVELAWNGFSWRNNSKGQKLHDDALMELFDVWVPMCYGTDQKTINRYWDSKVFKYPKLNKTPMVGVARVDRDGRVWGAFSKQGHVKGLGQILKEKPVDGINFFYGNGAKGRLTTGYDAHPTGEMPLLDFVSALRLL